MVRRHRGHASRLGELGAGGDVAVPVAVAASPALSVLPSADHGVRLMAVRSGRSVLRAASPGRSDMVVTRATETMPRGVVVFVGRAV